MALLESAQHDGVRGLRNVCARVKAAACADEMERYERVLASRSLRSWTDAEGAGRIDVRGPVDAIARVMGAIDPFEREFFETSRVAGRRERSDALAFDALVAWAAAPAGDDAESRRGPDSTVVARIDHAALVRGNTEPGEVCEIAGVGPVPVAVVRQMMDDAFLKAIVVDGTDVRAVAHLGRTITARQRTAVEEEHPECDIEGCPVSHGLEIDHNLPVEVGGPSALWNLDRLCPHDHRHKHRYDLRLVGPPGRMRFVRPDDPEYLDYLRNQIC